MEISDAEAVATLTEYIGEAPTDPDALEAWRACPLFAQPNGDAYTVTVYRRRWAATLEAATKKHPELSGMVLRDLRSWWVTRMKGVGADPTIAAKLAGHSVAMSARYTEPTREQRRRLADAIARKVAQ